jgi:D-hexose-6-phosphate mutarotase
MEPWICQSFQRSWKSVEIVHFFQRNRLWSFLIIFDSFCGFHTLWQWTDTKTVATFFQTRTNYNTFLQSSNQFVFFFNSFLWVCLSLVTLFGAESRLRQILRVQNNNSEEQEFDFTSALHTYFRIDDLNKVRIRPLKVWTLSFFFSQFNSLNSQFQIIRNIHS